MVKASAYTLEEIANKLNEAFGMFIDEEEAYGETIKGVKEELEKLVNKYPEDNELRDYFKAFEDFYEKREELDRKKEKERLIWLESEINHIVHWRKLGMSAGRVLPFRDFRSMRGETGRRGY